MTMSSFSCAPFAAFSWQHNNDNSPSPNFVCPGLTEADNIDGFYPNATGMQNAQHKIFCRVSGYAGRLVWAGKAPSYCAEPTNRVDMLYNANSWPYVLSVGTDSRYCVVSWNSASGRLNFTDDVTVELGAGMLIGGGNDWKWMRVGDPGDNGTNPAGTIRVPDGHALWFWGDKNWILRSRVAAAALVVTRNQTVVLAGDHSEDPCGYHVVHGTLQLGGDVPVTESNCRSGWWPAHATDVQAAAGKGGFFVEWAGTLVVGAENAIPKTATVSVSSAYDQPTDTTLFGKIRLDADTRCAALVIDGKKAKSGTWGATGSGADHVDDAIFSGPGLLVAGGEPLFIVVR